MAKVKVTFDGVEYEIEKSVLEATYATMKTRIVALSEGNGGGSGGESGGDTPSTPPAGAEPWTIGFNANGWQFCHPTYDGWMDGEFTSAVSNAICDILTARDIELSECDNPIRICFENGDYIYLNVGATFDAISDTSVMEYYEGALVPTDGHPWYDADNSRIQHEFTGSKIIKEFQIGQDMAVVTENYEDITALCNMLFSRV